MAESNGNGNGAIVTLGKVGKVIAWAGAVLAVLLSAQVVAFNAFTSAAIERAAAAQSREVRAQIAEARSGLQTKEGADLQMRSVQLQLDELRSKVRESDERLQRHLDQFRSTK